MSKFDKWMENKGYGHKGQDYKCLYNFEYKDTEVLYPTKQMYVGYMIEYCLERKIEIIIQYFASIQDIYRYLKEKIK